MDTGDAIQSSQAGSSVARKAYEKMDPQLCDKKVCLPSYIDRTL